MVDHTFIEDLMNFSLKNPKEVETPSPDAWRGDVPAEEEEEEEAAAAEEEAPTLSHPTLSHVAPPAPSPTRSSPAAPDAPPAPPPPLASALPVAHKLDAAPARQPIVTSPVAGTGGNGWPESAPVSGGAASSPSSGADGAWGVGDSWGATPVASQGAPSESVAGWGASSAASSWAEGGGASGVDEQGGKGGWAAETTIPASSSWAEEEEGGEEVTVGKGAWAAETPIASIIKQLREVKARKSLEDEFAQVPSPRNLFFFSPVYQPKPFEP